MDARTLGARARSAGDQSDGQPRILLLAMLPIGDTIWLAPTTRALRERYPHATITALAYRSNAALAARLPGVDETLIFTPPRSLGAALTTPGLVAAVRARRFDWAITFTSPAFKWMSLLAGIPRRTYMKFDTLWWLIPARHEAWRAAHATAHYYDAARELGLPPWRSVDQRPAFTLPASAEIEAARFLEAHAPTHVNAQGDAHEAPMLIAMHPGGAGLDGRKRWPADRFAALIQRLWRERGARVALLGGPDERALAEWVAKAAREGADMPPDAQPIVAAGRLSLLGAFALIERSALFIGNDSGLLHAAATLGVPYVGIFGPTAPTSFRPIPQRARQGRLLLPHTPCREPVAFVGSDVFWRGARCLGACDALDSVTPADAFDAVIETLAQANASSASGAPNGVAAPAL
jgi:ADP-heptose:LPS heptosyltransferase